MAAIIDRRVCAEIEGPFVVFLIGIRINRWWKPWAWVPVFRARAKGRPQAGAASGARETGQPGPSPE